MVGQSWFTDGLSPEESAFVVALNPAPYGFFEGLLETRHTLSRTISLPLAGEVNLWAFQNAPSPPGEDLLGMMEEAVRATEDLMKTPFPTNDLILMALGGSENFLGFAGVAQANHLRLIRFEDFLLSPWLIHHEVAHYYFTGLEIGPPWVLEGGADFGAAYTRHWTGEETLESQLQTSAASKQRNCVEYGIGSIHRLTVPDLPEPSAARACDYILGRHFFISLVQTLGQPVVSSALQEMYALAQSDAPNLTEEDVYRMLLKHTPPNLKPAFKELYRELHGGPSVDMGS